MPAHAALRSQLPTSALAYSGYPLSLPPPAPPPLANLPVLAATRATARTTARSRCPSPASPKIRMGEHDEGRTARASWGQLLLARALHCAKVASVNFEQGHIQVTETHANAVMSEVFAMQCMNASAGCLATCPMSRRNDAYTAIYFYRYL